MQRGRPTDYSDELAATICAEIAAGRSLRSICQEDWCVEKTTVFKWLAKYPDFADQYAKSVDERNRALAEDLLDISDDNTGDVQRDKLRVDTRKWLLSKLQPKKYGDKLTQELTGEDGGALQIVVKQFKLKD